MFRAAKIMLWGLAAGQLATAQYAGSQACKTCHPARFETQSKTGHAHALSLAPSGSPGHWAFGAGGQATTYVSQIDSEGYLEHGLSYYSATKSMALTPGHTNAEGMKYRTFDPVASVLRCFRCHSTGPLQLGAGASIQPSEPGVHCESCHGEGAAHVQVGRQAGHDLQSEEPGGGGPERILRDLPSKTSRAGTGKQLVQSVERAARTGLSEPRRVLPQQRGRAFVPDLPRSARPAAKDEGRVRQALRLLSPRAAASGGGCGARLRRLPYAERPGEPAPPLHQSLDRHLRKRREATPFAPDCEELASFTADGCQGARARRPS